MNSRSLNFVVCAGLACSGLGSVLVGCQTPKTAGSQPELREPGTALRAAGAAQPDKAFTLSENLTVSGDIRTERFGQVVNRNLCQPIPWPNTVVCSVDLDTTDGNNKRVRYEHWIGCGKDDYNTAYIINVYWGSLEDASAWEAGGVKLPASIKQGPKRDAIHRVSQSGGVHMKMDGGLALVVIEECSTFSSAEQSVRLTDLVDKDALFRPWYILVGRGRASGAYGSCYIMTCDDYSATKASVVWVHGSPTTACSTAELTGDIVPPNKVHVLDRCGAPGIPGPPVHTRPVGADDRDVKLLLTKLMNAVNPNHQPDCLLP